MRGDVVADCVPLFKVVEIAAEKAFLCGEPFSFYKASALSTKRPSGAPARAASASLASADARSLSET